MDGQMDYVLQQVPNTPSRSLTPPPASAVSPTGFPTPQQQHHHQYHQHNQPQQPHQVRQCPYFSSDHPISGAPPPLSHLLLPHYSNPHANTPSRFHHHHPNISASQPQAAAAGTYNIFGPPSAANLGQASPPYDPVHSSIPSWYRSNPRPQSYHWSAITTLPPPRPLLDSFYPLPSDMSTADSGAAGPPGGGGRGNGGSSSSNNFVNNSGGVNDGIGRREAGGVDLAATNPGTLQSSTAQTQHTQDQDVLTTGFPNNFLHQQTSVSSSHRPAVNVHTSSSSFSQSQQSTQQPGQQPVPLSATRPSETDAGPARTPVAMAQVLPPPTLAALSRQHQPASLEGAGSRNTGDNAAPAPSQSTPGPYIQGGVQGRGVDLPRFYLGTHIWGSPPRNRGAGGVEGRSLVERQVPGTLTPANASRRGDGSDYDSDEDADDERERAMDIIDQFDHRASQLREARIRQEQILRGQMSTTRVASRQALASLQSVDIDSLPEHERTCIICYNDFGVENPEGINEAPLRLPTCTHVFGDHCIKKWFKEADSCPYCRAQVPSEQRYTINGVVQNHRITDGTRAQIGAIRNAGAGISDSTPFSSSGTAASRPTRMITSGADGSPTRHSHDRRSSTAQDYHDHPRRRPRLRHGGSMAGGSSDFTGPAASGSGASGTPGRSQSVSFIRPEEGAAARAWPGNTSGLSANLPQHPYQPNPLRDRVNPPINPQQWSPQSYAHGQSLTWITQLSGAVLPGPSTGFRPQGGYNTDAVWQPNLNIQGQQPQPTGFLVPPTLTPAPSSGGTNPQPFNRYIMPTAISHPQLQGPTGGPANTTGVPGMATGLARAPASPGFGSSATYAYGYNSAEGQNAGGLQQDAQVVGPRYINETA